jgi:HSP20 family protein
MANIIRRRESAGYPQPAQGWERWDPFQIMRQMLRGEMLPEVGVGRGWGEQAFVPMFEVKETGDSYVFKADLPGVKEPDLDISLTGNQLVVSGKREAEHHEETDRFYAYERTYGSFSRTFTLPEGADADHVKAELREGVLTLVLPKKPEVQPKRITVGGGGKATTKA